MTEVDVASEMPPDVMRLQHLAEQLTQQPYVMPNVHGGLGRKAVVEQLALHGYAKVERAWRQIANRVKAEGTSAPTLRQLVFGADDILNPVPDRRDVAAAEKSEEEAERRRRREERSAAQLAYLRGETSKS